MVSSDVQEASWDPPLLVKAFRLFWFFFWSDSKKLSEISEQGVTCIGMFLKVNLAAVFLLRGRKAGGRDREKLSCKVTRPSI